MRYLPGKPVSHKIDKKDILEAKIPNVSMTTGGGVLVRLHNSGKVRPTTYTLEMDRLTGTMVLDTIIRKNENHIGIKVSYGSNGLSRALSKMKELGEQESDGSPENTEKYFRPVGLLYWDKAMDNK
jgi:hypothetical protein